MIMLPCSAHHVARDLLLSILLLLGSVCIYSGVHGASFVIDDERVKTLDISPALGRGYSRSANQFHSICLDVDETTEPSYNYEYVYTDVSSALDVKSSTKISGNVRSSFGWARVSARMEGEMEGSYQSETQTVMTTMRIERYYASVKENKSPLSTDAKTLLERKDYVGFFKACGPNYVRSIRRAQEVTAMFTFKSSNSEVTAKMKSQIQVAAFGYGGFHRGGVKSESSVNINRSMSSLKIEIFGYGLGLDKDGSDTLVATSLEEYNKAMNFAFTSMTRGNQGSAQTGMIYGIELVPWTDNTAFQVASNVHDIADDSLMYSVPYDLIPNAVETTTEANGVEVVTYSCNVRGYTPDDSNKKCCKEDDKKVVSGDAEKKYCQPVRRFPVDLLKQNLQNNGELVAVMDSILHQKRSTIMDLERCIQVLRTLNATESDTYLLTPDSVLNADDSNYHVTVHDLYKFLDPGDDMASVELLNMELDEYIAMYYNPCMTALFGMNADAMGDSEPGDMMDYFMMKPWSNHPECAISSCAIPTNSWNRDQGGCGPSYGTSGVVALVAVEDDQTPASEESTEELDHCAKKGVGSGVVCERNTKMWNDQKEKLKGCWNDSTPFVLIERYCTPRLSEKERRSDVNKSKTIRKKCI